MKTYLDEILTRAEEQTALLCAAHAMLAEPTRGARALRLCLSASLLVLLMLIPAQCSAYFF